MAGRSNRVQIWAGQLAANELAWSKLAGHSFQPRIKLSSCPPSSD
jgi:hypothetical protein